MCISTWISTRDLSLNLSQTEILMFLPKRTPHTIAPISDQCQRHYFRCLSQNLWRQPSFLSSITYIQTASKYCSFNLHRTSRIQLLLSTSTINSFQTNIISHGNYCNDLLIDPLLCLLPISSHHIKQNDRSKISTYIM